MGCSENTNGDLATVGDEDFLELHNGRIGPQTVVDRVPVLVLVVIDELRLVDSLLGLLGLGENGRHGV